MLRIHNWDGTISKEKYAHAAAAYGNLVVNRHSVAICISSGQPSPEEVLTGNPSGHHRVDASDFRASSRPEILTGDHILVWTFNSNTLTSVQIPQDEAPALVSLNSCILTCGNSKTGQCDFSHSMMLASNSSVTLI